MRSKLANTADDILARSADAYDAARVWCADHQWTLGMMLFGAAMVALFLGPLATLAGAGQ